MPPEMPVTMLVVAPIVAIPGATELQVPPGIASLNVVVAPIQT